MHKSKKSTIAVVVIAVFFTLFLLISNKVTENKIRNAPKPVKEQYNKNDVVVHTNFGERWLLDIDQDGKVDVICASPWETGPRWIYYYVPGYEKKVPNGAMARFTKVMPESIRAAASQVLKDINGLNFAVDEANYNEHHDIDEEAILEAMQDVSKKSNTRSPQETGNTNKKSSLGIGLLVMASLTIAVCLYLGYVLYKYYHKVRDIDNIRNDQEEGANMIKILLAFFAVTSIILLIAGIHCLLADRPVNEEAILKEIQNVSENSDPFYPREMLQSTTQKTQERYDKWMEDIRIGADKIEYTSIGETSTINIHIDGMVENKGHCIYGTGGPITREAFDMIRATMEKEGWEFISIDTKMEGFVKIVGTPGTSDN